MAFSFPSYPFIDVDRGGIGFRNISSVWLLGLHVFQLQDFVHEEYVSLSDFFHEESISLLLMAEILHQLIGSLSHYLQGFIH